MAGAIGNRPKASVVKQASINHTSVFLQSLPDKPKEDLSLKEAIAQLGDPIKASLAKGYTYQEIAAMLSDKGIRISAFTLKNYVPSGKRRSSKDQAIAKPVARRGRKASTDSDTQAESSVEAAIAKPKAEASSPTATKGTRGGARRGTAAKAKSGSESTVKQPAAKRGRRTAAAKSDPSATTAPSTRRRKKADS